jgi:putative ABC transport system permease protein
MARHFFGHASPIGKRFTVSSARTPLEIVGVVQDASYNSPRDRDRMMFYYPYTQQIVLHRLIRMCLAVRAAGPPAAIAGAVRRELQAIDPDLPVLKVETLEQHLDDLLSQERLVAILSGLFAGLAVLLACLGLYGVIAYGVARRANEIGIRIALGATRGAIAGTVLGESLTLVAAGIAAGLPAALAANRAISGRFFGVDPADPATFLAAAVFLAAVAALAGYLPARRAARIDPMNALRCE